MFHCHDSRGVPRHGPLEFAPSEGFLPNTPGSSCWLRARPPLLSPPLGSWTSAPPPPPHGGKPNVYPIAALPGFELTVAVAARRSGAPEQLSGRRFVHGAREGRQPMNLERVLRSRAAWLRAQPNPTPRGFWGLSRKPRERFPGGQARWGRKVLGGHRGLQDRPLCHWPSSSDPANPERPGHLAHKAAGRASAGGAGPAPMGDPQGGGRSDRQGGVRQEAGGGRPSWRLWGYDSPAGAGRKDRRAGARAKVCQGKWSEGHNGICAESEI